MIVDSNYIDDECPACFGTGEDEFDEMGRCKICGGDGLIWTWIEDNEPDCSEFCECLEEYCEADMGQQVSRHMIIGYVIMR